MWGVEPLLTPRHATTDEMIRQVVAVARKAGHIADGDLVVITAGLPLPARGRTNLLKLHIVGEPV